MRPYSPSRGEYAIADSGEEGYVIERNDRAVLIESFDGMRSWIDDDDIVFVSLEKRRSNPDPLDYQYEPDEYRPWWR